MNLTLRDNHPPVTAEDSPMRLRRQFILAELRADEAAPRGLHKSGIGIGLVKKSNDGLLCIAFQRFQ